MSTRRFGLLASALGLSLATVACSSGQPTPAPEPTRAPQTSTSASTPAKVRTITVGAYGSGAELEAIDRALDGFNATSVTRRVELVTWPDHDAALESVLAGDAPDVFMASRTDLRELVDNEAIQPVSLLLDERGVDFGDRFHRDAVDAFAQDDELQCMAYAASPMVIFYNDRLVDFERMARRGLDVPGGTEPVRWSFEQFAAAAQFASRRGDRRGVWIEPTLSGLAPFIYSGGGRIFDDEESPTSLAFSDEATREALNRILPVLRDPTLTPTQSQLERSTPLQLFKRGRLAMIAGYRDLVPRLRRVEGLSFDVISMPVLDDQATVGDVSGLCISADTDAAGDAADVIAYMVSDSAVETVTLTGHIVPANTQVAGSDAFLSPEQMPAHAEVFNAAIRRIVTPPDIPDRDALLDVVDPLLHRLVTAPGILDLEVATEAIDRESQAVLSPEPPVEDSGEDSGEDSTD